MSAVDPKEFHVDVMVNPERELALETLRLLQTSVAHDVAVFAGGELQVINLEITSDSPVTGRKIKDLRGVVGQAPVLLAAIDREGKTLIPKGNTILMEGDQVYVVAAIGAIPMALALCGHEHAMLKRVMIAGGSVEAFYLGQLLQEHGVQTTILVDDRDRAMEFAEKLHKALILNGDATDIELMELEAVGEADAFVALTDEDQTNILSGLIAKHVGAKQVITLVNRIAFVPLARRVGLDAAVSPRLSAANAIMGYVRRGSVTRVSTFKDTDAEAISFSVSPESPLIGQLFSELEFPDGGIIAAIERGQRVFVPQSDSALQAGDSAIVFALPEAIPEITKLFPVE